MFSLETSQFRATAARATKMIGQRIARIETNLCSLPDSFQFE
jgi:hypothetical protein